MIAAGTLKLNVGVWIGVYIYERKIIKDLIYILLYLDDLLYGHIPGISSVALVLCLVHSSFFLLQTFSVT